MMERENSTKINWASEYEKCRDSPYYFATNYLMIKREDEEPILFTTLLTEEEFNEQFNRNR